jgi:hypothetical protein
MVLTPSVLGAPIGVPEENLQQLCRFGRVGSVHLTESAMVGGFDHILIAQWA